MSLVEKLRSTPFVSRVVPFFIFAALTACQGQFGEASKYWFYFVKIFVGMWLLWAIWPVVPEMRWKFSVPSLVIGILVFVIWVGLDPLYPKWIKPGKEWNPHMEFGSESALAWTFIITRIVGSTLMVPPLEELFYRSFVYRYIIKQDFTSVPLKLFHARAFIITSVIFGVVHREWLAGILCGFAYQWLVCRTGRLGEAMTAHGITNLLLGLWVVFKGAWQFW